MWGNWKLCLPDVDMAFWSEVNLASQHTLPAIAPGQLTNFAALQVPVTLLDLGVTVVQWDVPNNLKDVWCLNDLHSQEVGTADGKDVCL